MMNQSDYSNQLEDDLRALTAGEKAPSGLWKKALERVDAAERRETWSWRSAPIRLWRSPMARAAAVIGLTVGVGLWLFMPRDLYRTAGPPFAGQAAPPALGRDSLRTEQLRRGTLVEPTDGSAGFSYTGGYEGRAELGDAMARPGAEPELPPAERFVIRKATIELVVDDAERAFLRATHLLNEGLGEFVEESSLRGDDDERQKASLTLRVAAHRLDQVMAGLRELGELVSEAMTGEDVTSQIVDIEARLRNEKRIEEELLGLLDTRDDAPLKEVLELRREMATVRENIERLMAQQARMSRLVSLATILVLIDEPGEDEEGAWLSDGLWSHFGEVTARAWDEGLWRLANTVGWIVEILVSGAIWWTIAMTALVAWSSHRRKLAREAEAVTP